MITIQTLNKIWDTIRTEGDFVELKIKTIEDDIIFWKIRHPFWGEIHCHDMHIDIYPKVKKETINKKQNEG